MNAQDRKAVSGIVSELEALRSQVEDIGARLRELADAEHDKFDNMNEGLRAAMQMLLQSSDNGQAIEEAASNLSDAIEEALDALGNLEE